MRDLHHFDKSQLEAAAQGAEALVASAAPLCYATAAASMITISWLERENSPITCSAAFHAQPPLPPAAGGSSGQASPPFQLS